MIKHTRILFALALAGLIWGCTADEPEVFSAGEVDGDDAVTVTFAIGSLDASLDLNKVKRFRIRIYSHTPYSEEETPLFDSLAIHGCFAASGTDVRIQDLKAGNDRFVFYEGFADDACADRVALGLRGGISIASQSALQKKAAAVSCTADDACVAEVHPDAACDCEKDVDGSGKKLAYCKNNATSVCTVTPPVFIPLFEVGKFNRFPVASEALHSEAATVTCTADSECSSVHPAATCDQELGRCSMAGLFPFTPLRPRAFHTATALQDGTILFAGGFNRVRDGELFYAAAPFFEGYSPYTGLFFRPAVQENYGGQNVALHRATLLPSSRLVISGGVSVAEISYALGDELNLQMVLPHTFSGAENCPDNSCTNFSKALVSANLNPGSAAVVQGTLPYRLFLHRSAHVKRGDDAMLLLTGGLTYNDAGQQSLAVNQHMLCTAADILADDPNMSCAQSDNSDAFPPRFSHADACLVGGAGQAPCEEYMVFGGVDGGVAPGEVFSADASPFNTLLSFSETTSLAKAHLPELARVERDTSEPALLYSFGGIGALKPKNDAGSGELTLSFGAPDMQPYQVNVNLNEVNYSMTTAGLDLTALDSATEVYRLFHSVSVLDGGRIMLAGGIGDDSLPTKSVLFFEEPATHALTYVAKTAMRESRFGHTATVLNHGLLKGAVLVVGGLTVADKESGAISFAESAEIYIPKK